MATDLVGELTRLFVLHKAGALDARQFAGAKTALLPACAAAAAPAVVATAPRTTKGAGGAMDLYIRMPGAEPGSDLAAVQVPAAATVADVLAAVAAQCPGRGKVHHLKYQGKQLSDGAAPLADLGIGSEAILDAEQQQLRFRGGGTSISKDVDSYWMLQMECQVPLGQVRTFRFGIAQDTNSVHDFGGVAPRFDESGFREDWESQESRSMVTYENGGIFPQARLGRLRDVAIIRFDGVRMVTEWWFEKSCKSTLLNPDHEQPHETQKLKDADFPIIPTIQAHKQVGAHPGVFELLDEDGRPLH